VWTPACDRWSLMRGPKFLDYHPEGKQADNEFAPLLAGGDRGARICCGKLGTQRKAKKNNLSPNK